MRFFIVHELRGITTPDSGRMRVRASCSLGGGRAEALAGALASLEGISDVRANALVGSLLIFYDNDESRVTALTLLLGAASANGQFGQSDLPAEIEPAPGNGLMPLARYIFVRPFLPLALRVMNSIVGALPYIFKGLGALLRGTLSVDVLDAAAIEMRHELCIGRAALLHVAVRDAEIQGMVDDRLVLKRRQPAVHAFVLRRPVHRRVLVHQGNLHRVAECLMDPVEHAHALVAVARQHEMAHEDAAAQAAVRREVHGADLAHHGADGWGI